VEDFDSEVLLQGAQKPIVLQHSAHLGLECESPVPYCQYLASFETSSIQIYSVRACFSCCLTPIEGISQKTRCQILLGDFESTNDLRREHQGSLSFLETST
jgi:hypothetical protein